MSYEVERGEDDVLDEVHFAAKPPLLLLPSIHIWAGFSAKHPPATALWKGQRE
jgi:hypothetical protein